MSPRQGCLSPLGRMMERPPRVVGVLPSFTSVLPLIPLASTDYGMVHLFIPLLLIALSLLLPPLQASNCSLPCMKYPPTPSVGSRPDAGFNPLPEVCLATYSSHCYCILSTTVPPPLYPLPSREGLRSRRDATVSSLMAPSSPQLLPQLQQRRWQRACRGGACTCYGHRRFAKGASALSLMVLMAPSSPGWMPLVQLRRWRQAR